MSHSKQAILPKSLGATLLVSRQTAIDCKEIPMRCNCANPYHPVKIIYNPPATIVFWEDGTKTVVKAMEGTVFNPYHGFTAALAKRVYGSSTRVNKIVQNGHQAYREVERDYTLLQLFKGMNEFGGYKNEQEHDQG